MLEVLHLKGREKTQKQTWSAGWTAQGEKHREEGEKNEKVMIPGIKEGQRGKI